MPEVVSYLRFLHEVSRKILQRSGFENVLYGKSRRMNPMYCPYHETSERLESHLNHVARHLRDSPGRGLYLGIGLVVGQHKGSRLHRISAPLIFCPIEILPDEDGLLDTEIEWNATRLNYDFLTLLLTGDEPDAEADEYRTDDKISPDSLKCISDLETQLDKMGENADVKLFNAQFQEKLFRTLQDGIPQAQSVTISNRSFHKEKLNSLVEEGSLQFFPHTFYYVASVPEQLSTTVALQRLIRQCQDKGFKNPLLRKLLEGVIQNSEVRLEKNLACPEEHTLDKIPLPLSERQHAAIKESWRQEISYIQGPPGTGKSHTIAATMLAGLLHGKRVLMVSHKTPAVQRVYELLTAALGDDSIVYLGPTTEQRKALRTSIQKRVQRTSLSISSRLNSAADLSRAKLNALLERRREILHQLSTCLERERSHYLSNEEFLRKRRELRNNFAIASESDILMPQDGARLHEFSRMASKVRTIVERASESDTLRRKDAIFIRRAFKIGTQRFQASPSLLSPTLLGASYLQEHLELTSAFKEVGRVRKRIETGATATLRRQLEATEQELNGERRKYLRSFMDAHIAENLATGDEDVIRFDKMLHWRRHSKISEAMAQIKFENVTRAFPLWVGEMRHLGEFLPFAPGLFDLIVVDESSQVNIAEITPAFYRGDRFCVVGDNKQLGLNAAGLFSLNRRFEQLVWNQCLDERRITYAQGDERALLVSKSSILDFVTCPANRFSIKKTMLNEHFRSLPQHASYTSDSFYIDDGGLRLMREVPKNLERSCFRFLEVGGKRDSQYKMVPEEVDEVIRQLESIIINRSYVSEFEFAKHGYSEANPPSIGVISFLTDQRNVIRERLEQFSTADLLRHRVLVGTPEDFQGNERHIILLTFGLDGESRWAPHHYENASRFNVATSRAIDFVIVITGAVPGNAARIRQYLRHFGVTPKSGGAEPVPAEHRSASIDKYVWKYSPERRESEFEIRVDEHLHRFIDQNRPRAEVRLYNQVEACGEKRLDFVLYNASKGECCAVEVDGRDHFCQDGRTYSEEHLARMDVLKRAGWKIVNVPYYEWYHHGWLCDQDSPAFARWLHSFYSQLKNELRI